MAEPVPAPEPASLWSFLSGHKTQVATVLTVAWWIAWHQGWLVRLGLDDNLIKQVLGLLAGSSALALRAGVQKAEDAAAEVKP